MSAWELEAQKKRLAAIAFLEKNGESVSTGKSGNVLVKQKETHTDNTLALLLNRKASNTKAEDDKKREQEAKLAVIKQQEDARRAKYVEEVAKSLPPNWETVVDNATKKCYYWNHITNETKWERPVAGEESSSSSSSTDMGGNSSGSSSSSSSSSSSTTAAISIHDTTATTTAELPADWEEKIHPATAQTYYIHKITGEKSFAFPGSELAIAAANRPKSSLLSMLGKRTASGPVASGPQMNKATKPRQIDPLDPGGSRNDKGRIGTMADSTATGPLWQQRPYPAPGTVLRTQPPGGSGGGGGYGPGRGGTSFHSGGRGGNSGGGGRGFGGRSSQGRGSSSGGGGQYGRAAKPAGVTGHYGPT